MNENNRVVYFNGKFIPEAEARISIYDSALMFGDMVFEMTRSFNGAQFRLRAHLERLYAGLKILRIPIDLSISEFEDICHRTMEANKPSFGPDDEHRLMIDVSRGILGLYRNVVGVAPGTNVIVADFPLRWTVVGMGHLYDTGINAVVVSQRAIPGMLLDPKIKNRSRIHYLMANIEAGAMEGEDNWALLLDPDGFVAEGSGDNFLIIKDGVVISPEGRNILRGVSRDYILHELCPKAGIKTSERNIEPYDVYTADEAFMSATPFCMLPVTRINGVKIGDGKPGPVFRKMLELWGKDVGVDIAAQIKAWNARDVQTVTDAPTPYRFKSQR